MAMYSMPVLPSRDHLTGLVIHLAMVVMAVLTCLIVWRRVRGVDSAAQLGVYVVQAWACIACVLYVPNVCSVEWVSFVS